MEYAHRKKCLRILSTQGQASSDLLNLQEVDTGISLFTNIRAEISFPTDEGMTDRDAAAQEEGQLQLHIDSSIPQVDPATVEQTINLPLRPGGGGIPTVINQSFAWTRPSKASASTFVF